MAMKVVEFMGIVRRKITRMIKLENGHCGHEELVAKADYARIDLERFIKGEYEKAVQKERLDVTGFSLLWQKILRSSIWIKESKETRLVWITMLAMKDKEGLVQSSVIGLADAAKVTKEECEAALEVLMAPDEDDTSEVEEGRRIRKVQGGWQVINNDLYRFSTEAKREFWRETQAEYRDKKGKEKENELAMVEDNGEIKEIWDEWNKLDGFPRCLVMSDKRRRGLEKRMGDVFFAENWKAAMERMSRSSFCKGKGERGWKSTLEWFIQADSVAKIMEGKYDDPPAKKPVVNQT
jgi:hypothetical protein